MRSELIKQIFLAFAQSDRDKFIETAPEAAEAALKPVIHLRGRKITDYRLLPWIIYFY